MTAVALLLLVALTAADLPADLENAIVGAPRPEDLPAAGAALLRHERIFEIDEHGRVQVTLRQTIKVLREDGRHFQTIWLPCTTSYQQLEVRQARCVLPGLRLVDVREVALQQVTMGRTGDLTGWRLQFPYAAPGVVLDYEVQITDTRPSMPGRFNDSFQMQTEEPVVQARYVVRTPAATSFERHVHGQLAPPAVRRRGGSDETTWVAENLPGLDDEPQRPSEARLALWLMVSSYRSWDEVAARYRAAALTMDTVDTALREEARRRLEGSGDPVRTLHHWVCSKVAYAGGPLERGLPGIQPQPAYETWRQRMGDCKDQATLLIALLQHVAGLRAWPALLRRPSQGPLAENLPAMLQFDHVVVAVPTGNGHLRWLDPTWSLGPGDYVPNGIQGARALVVSDQNAYWATVPAMPAGANVLERQAELKVVSDGGLDARVKMVASGGFEQSFRTRFRSLSRDAVARELSVALNAKLAGVRFDGGTLEFTAADDLDRPFHLGYAFRAPAYGLLTQQLVLVPVGVFERPEVPAALVAPTRRYPVRLAASPEITISRLRFVLPPELRVREVPQDRQGSETFGSFRTICRRTADAVEWSRDVTIQRAEIGPDEVERARGWYTALAAADQQLIVLERR